MRKEMNSSVIAEVEYHSAVGVRDAELRVFFHDGTDRTYIDVPKEVFKSLVESDSQGKYFNQNIRGIYKERS